MGTDIGRTGIICIGRGAIPERENIRRTLYRITMFLRRVIETTFQNALAEELTRRDMTIRELSTRTGIPLPTLYKCSSGERDPRLSTVRRIAEALEPKQARSVAVIAARFLLDEVAGLTIEVRGRPYPVRGYPANSLEECIVAAVRAEKEGAAAIVCAPVLASIVERIVDIPVVILKPKAETVTEALEAARRRL
jgi:predicted transcriptional regulator